MIKLVLAEEEPKPVPTVRFEFRRHAQGDYSPSAKNLAYLVGEQMTAPGPVLTKCYPIKIDGDRQIVEVRRRDFESLGFTVVVRD